MQESMYRRTVFIKFRYVIHILHCILFIVAKIELFLLHLTAMAYKLVRQNTTLQEILYIDTP